MSSRVISRCACPSSALLRFDTCSATGVSEGGPLPLPLPLPQPEPAIRILLLSTNCHKRSLIDRCPRCLLIAVAHLSTRFCSLTSLVLVKATQRVTTAGTSAHVRILRQPASLSACCCCVAQRPPVFSLSQLDPRAAVSTFPMARTKQTACQSTVRATGRVA